MSIGELTEARAFQDRLQKAGGHHSLESILTEFGFISADALGEILEAVKSASGPGRRLPSKLAKLMEDRGKRFGHFLLFNEVGRGGLGVVLRAWDLDGRRMVAVKFLGGEEQVDREQGVAFLREGARLAELDHPNIVPVHEIGEIQGQYYISLQYLEGVGLEELIHSARIRGRLSPFYDNPDRYIGIVRDIARAVHYLHCQDPPLVHCDLKPQNIVMDLNFKPYLVDFGLARSLSPAVIGENVIQGSPSYMAPEQILGRREEIDTRTDIYGLGAILYELLCGRPPFTGELKEVLDKTVLLDPPAPGEVVQAAQEISARSRELPHVPQDLEAICVKCLQKDREERYATADEVANELEGLLEKRNLHVKSSKVVDLPSGDPEPAGDPEPRHTTRRAALKGFVAGGVFVGVVIALVLLFAMPAKEQVDSQRAKAESGLRGLGALLRIEEAEKGYEAFSEKYSDKMTREWVTRKLQEMQWLRNFRDNLGMMLDRRRPDIPEFRTRSGESWDSYIVRGSHYSVIVWHPEGERELTLPEIDPELLLDLMENYGGQIIDQKIRQGMVLFMILNHLPEKARKQLSAVKDATAHAYLKRLIEMEEKRLRP